jgi:hypothetical protein
MCLRRRCQLLRANFCDALIGVALTTHIPSLSGLIEPFEHYPKVIRQAILLVESHPSITLILTRATRRVLRALVARCDRLNGSKPFEAPFDCLAEESSTSTKTVQRALKALAKLGWVEQVGDGRDDHGSYAIRAFRLLPGLCELLRLPSSQILPRKTKLSDGLYVNLEFKKDHPEIQEKEQKPQGPVELPAELASLPDELEISPAGIAKLRGQAHRAGYNLAHIVACARERMRKLGVSKHRAYAYLESMIAKPNVDYAARAAPEGRIAHQAAMEDRAAAAAKKHAGRAYIGPDGYTHRFRADGRVEILDGGIMLGFLPMDQVEDLAARAEAGELAIPGAPSMPTPDVSAPAISTRADIRSRLFGMLSMLKASTP